MKKDIKGKISVEKLSHFQCGACNKWWSIGDATKRNKWFCPWCGVSSHAKKKSPPEGGDLSRLSI